MTARAILLATTLVAGCTPSSIPDNCIGGCLDACEQMSSSKIQACVGQYNSGYEMGFQDGLKNMLTDGVNTEPFVAGYWDGHADGLASRPTQ